MRDPSDEHEALGVVDRVHDPVVAHPDPEVVSSRELRRAARARVDSEPVYRRLDPITHDSAKPAEPSRGFGMQPDLIHRDLGLAVANVGPRDRSVPVLAGLKRSEAVLEIVEPLE